MLPNNPMNPGPMQGGNVPVGPGPKAGPGGNPEDIKAQLKMLLSKAKQIADDNGINFSQVVSEVTGDKIKSDVPLPKPPKAEY